MLSARSDTEFCRNDAARLAAMSRRRASCRARSGRSRDFSRVTPLRARRIFFGTGGGNCFYPQKKRNGGNGSRREKVNWIGKEGGGGGERERERETEGGQSSEMKRGTKEHRKQRRWKQSRKQGFKMNASQILYKTAMLFLD